VRCAALTCKAGAFSGGCVEDQGACAGCRIVQVRSGHCVSAAAAAAAAAADEHCRTLGVICGAAGEGEGARSWNERARQEIDKCGGDVALPHNEV
jgi:hypothetical protein